MSSWKKEIQEEYNKTLSQFWKAGGSGDNCPNEKAKRLKEKLRQLKIEGKKSAYGHRFYCGCKGWD